MDFGINVTSIDRLYQEGPWHEVVILDEFDSIVSNYSHLATEQGVRGLWQLKERKVFAFSATSSLSYERFVANCITRPKSLSFKSEYEMVHGVDPVTDAVVVPCEDKEKLLKSLEGDLAKAYDSQPVIIILDSE